MRGHLPCRVGRPWGSIERKGYIPREKRDLTRHCLVPPRSSAGKNTEKLGFSHPWAEEMWVQNLRARGRKEQKGVWAVPLE